MFNRQPRSLTNGVVSLTVWRLDCPGALKRLMGQLRRLMSSPKGLMGPPIASKDAVIRFLRLANPFTRGGEPIKERRGGEIHMATTNKTTNTGFMTELQNMVSGLTNDVPSSLKSMNVGGSSMTMAQVLAQMQTFLLLFTTVVSAKQAYQAAVAAKKAGTATARAFYENVVANLKQVFGTNQAQLAGFGINPPKTKAKG